MTFNEARRELEQLTGANRYRGMYYTLVDRGDGTIEQECRVYVDGCNTSLRAKPTWEAAIAELRAIMQPEQSQLPAADGAPTGDVEGGKG